MKMDGLWAIETHAHTAEVSLCAKLRGAETARGVKAAGCDALIITDHYTPEFFPEGLEGAAYAARLHEFFAGYRAAKAVASGECYRGILICGTGIGIGIAASKVKGTRVCTCSDVYSAELSKRHNNSNILTMGARVVGVDLAKMIATHWLTAEFEGGRHQRRIDMITAIENGAEL